MDEFSSISHILKKVKVSKANHPFLILSHKKLLIQASKTMRKFLKVVENKNIFKITSENDTRPGYIFSMTAVIPQHKRNQEGDQKVPPEGPKFVIRRSQI